MDEPLRGPGTAPDVAMPSAAERTAAPPGALFRQDVNAAVEEGLGYFLQRVSVDPEVVDGKFRGFRIVELRPIEWWQGVDLRPGDIVTQVNGMSIERDIDAYQAFQSLRSAPALRVTLVRAGAPRELVFSIVDRDAKGVQKPASARPAPAETPKPAAGKQSS